MRTRALQLAERRGVALAHLHVLLEVETRAAALVEERHSHLPRAVLDHRRGDGARREHKDPIEQPPLVTGPVVVRLDAAQ